MKTYFKSLFQGKNLIVTAMLLFIVTLAVKGQTETEPNNDFPGTANVFTTQGISGSTSSGADDWFKITMPLCGMAEFYLTSNVGGSSYQLGAYYDDNSNNSYVITSKSGVTLTNDPTLEIVASAGCEIWVLVKQTAGSPITSYTLNAAINTDDGMECSGGSINSSFNTAKLVSADTTFEAYLQGYTCGVANTPEKEYYKVATGSGVLNLGITGINSTQDLLVTFYDNAYQQIAVTQSSFCQGGNVNTYGVLLCSGASYFSISENHGLCNGATGYNSSNDPFIVTLSFDDADACECNNTFETACEVQPNGSFDAKLWGRNSMAANGDQYFDNREEDHEYYTFTIPPNQCGVMNLGITGINVLQHLLVKFYDVAYHEIASMGGITCQGGDVNYGVIMGAGTYYFRIYEDDGYCTGPGATYSLIDDPFHVTLSFDIDDPCECNNNFTYACLKEVTDTFNFKIYGSNGPVGTSSLNTYAANDRDFIEIIPENCGTVTFKVVGIPSTPFGFTVKASAYEHPDTAIVNYIAGPVTGNNGTLTLTFPVTPGHRYYVMIYEEWDDLMSNSNMTAQISFVPTLATPSISPASNVINVSQGQSVTLTSSSSVYNLWSLNGETTPSIIFTAQQDTCISLHLENGNCFSGADSVCIDVTIPSGLSEIDNMHVSVYPNPNSGSFTIEAIIENNGEALTEIKNVLGQTVYSLTENVSSGQYKKNINVNLSEGIYYFSFQISESRITQKIEIVR